MKTVTAQFLSPKAGTYLATMAKHFGRKIKVTEDAGATRLHFSCGLAELTLTPEGLGITVSAEDQPLLEMTCGVVESHLLRFAFREAPEALDWRG